MNDFKIPMVSSNCRIQLPIAETRITEIGNSQKQPYRRSRIKVRVAVLGIMRVICALQSSIVT